MRTVLREIAAQAPTTGWPADELWRKGRRRRRWGQRRGVGGGPGPAECCYSAALPWSRCSCWSVTRLRCFQQWATCTQ